MRIGNRQMAAAVMASLFLTGAVTGALVISLLDLRPPTAPGAQFRGRAGPFAGRGGGPGALGARPFLDRLDRQLDLSPTQYDSIAAILSRDQEATQEAMRAVRPGLLARLDSTNSEISRLLSDEQRVRFDELIRSDRGALRGRFQAPPPFPRP